MSKIHDEHSYLYPPFRCIRVGKSVLFVYSINVDMDKYLDLAESWHPLE